MTRLKFASTLAEDGTRPVAAAQRARSLETSNFTFETSNRTQRTTIGKAAPPGMTSLFFRRACFQKPALGSPLTPAPPASDSAAPLPLLGLSPVETARRPPLLLNAASPVADGGALTTPTMAVNLGVSGGQENEVPFGGEGKNGARPDGAVSGHR